MFTPKMKGWWKEGTLSSPASNLSPRNGETSVKGKAVAIMESTPPGTMVLTGLEDDSEGLVQKVARLENELFEYQYNMGLLLIEKKEWTSKFEELRQALADAKDTFQREQEVHLISLSEVEKREENLMKALGVERQCVTDLENALREMRSGNAEIKFTSDSKLTEANALVISVEQKSLEVEAKLHAADAKFAELSRKTSEIERKSREVEAKENALRRDRLSLNSEQDARNNAIYKEREELREWETKLQQEEERLSELRRILNQREERTNENDHSLKQKQGEIEELQKKIDVANTNLKMKEDDLSRRIVNLTIKEKEADAVKNHLEMKEKELLAMEEMLSARENVEIQKLLDEHKAILESKKHEFEVEIEQKRRVFDDELKTRAIEVDKKEVEMNHLEEKIKKREQALEKKLEKFKEKEIDLESKSKSLKEKEKSINDEEEKLETEKKEILVDKEEMINLRIELERMRGEIEEQHSKINEERDQLKITEEEREEYLRLQSELKQEIENYRLQKDLLVKETEELRREKERFEKEWEEMDEKRVSVAKELEYLTLEKEKFEKQIRLEEEKLNDEKSTTQEYIKRELETLKLDKESFAASMEHEKAVIAENTQSERRQMLEQFDVQKRELETEMQKKWDDMENQLRVKETQFEAEREKEMSNINYLREVARREMDEMKLERSRLEKEKQETAANQKHIEVQQIEMRKDIDQLVGLSSKLKDQRQQFIKERERFISSIEKHRNCTTCGEIASDFLISDILSLPGNDIVDALPLPSLADGYIQASEGQQQPQASPAGVASSLSPASKGTVSWIRKCTSKIFQFSPTKKMELPPPENLNVATTSEKKHVDEEQPSTRLLLPDFEVAEESIDIQEHRTDVGNQELGADLNGMVEENLQDQLQSEPRGSQRPGTRGKRRIHRTRSVKEVVTEAKSILGDDFERGEHGNGSIAELNSVDENREESVPLDEGKSRNLRKRTRALTSQSTASEQDIEHSHSESVSVDGRRSRRKTVQATQSTMGGGAPRYNLRRPKTVPKVANGAVSGRGRAKVLSNSRVIRDEISDSNAAEAHSISIASENGGSTQHLQVEEGGADHLEGNADTTSKLAEEEEVLSDEIEGTPKGKNAKREDEEEEDEEEDGEEDEEEAQHPGEVSVGKKLWTFLTT
ncbi:nuclear matrix constituent protein 1-like isoform X2 [Impatiens glandulifera]|uniref:nuclear matrix constituent protein 1-like isoform X2 n=1 Tax=Impatiens glandulifera TaxID=253017 RepID=UPI001FB106A6|nr:nuclear matrix constituent protein 1-like isoform X2 [Impatiens glandulifera]